MSGTGTGMTLVEREYQCCSQLQLLESLVDLMGEKMMVSLERLAADTSGCLWQGVALTLTTAQSDLLV